MFEESVVDSPNVIMKVTERGGEDVKSAQVGDPLELHFEIFDEQSPYEIFVRDLVAKDGNDQSEIVLIDSRGCPAEGQIMGPLVKDANNAKILLSNFDAFKFPTSEVVQFRAHVTPCMPTCEPVDCTYDDYYGSGQQSIVSSYGKRKRRALTSTASTERHLVTNSFVVMDKFQQGKKKQESGHQEQARIQTQAPPSFYNVPKFQQKSPDFMNFNNDFQVASEQQVPEELLRKEEAEEELCINVSGMIGAIVTFLVLQVIIAIVWTQLWQRKKKRSEKEDYHTRHMFNPYAIRT